MGVKHKSRKRIWIPVVLLVVVLLGVLLAEPIYFLYEDITFYREEHTPTELRVKAYCEEKRISYKKYPQSMIELLERNPETEDFVLNYPFREEGEYDLSEFEGSTSVPLFLQWDTRWGYEIYGSDCIAITGCGPTCLAMVGYHLTGSPEFTPEKVADFAWNNDYYVAGHGSSWTLISEGSGMLGLEATELPLVKEIMVESVEAGKPVILAMGPGDFTTSGHYIVLTGWEDGAFQVNDPNSVINSEQLWTYEALESQIRNIWSIDVQAVG